MAHSHRALDDLVVVAEGALEHLVQLVVLLDHDLLRALLSATHVSAVPESERFGVWFARSARSASLAVTLVLPWRNDGGGMQTRRAFGRAR